MKSLLIIFLFLTTTESKFPDSSYAQYSWQEFYQLSEANQPIDFTNPDLDLLSACVFYASNEQRELKNKKTFSFSPNLRNAANFHTQQMIEKNFFDHINPRNPPYRTPDKRMIKFDCRFKTYGENIAYFSTENMTYLEAGKQLVKDWMNSPGHRANLLNKQFTFLGCGVGIKSWNKSQGSYLIYGTQDFGGIPY